MKIKFAIFVLVASIPSVVMAGVNFFSHYDPIYIISAQQGAEFKQKPAQTILNYRMVWNEEAGKFDLLPGHKRRPITIEEKLSPEAIEPQPNEPIYYGTNVSI